MQCLFIFGRSAIAVLDLCGTEFHGFGVAMLCQCINDRAARISQSEQLGHFVIGFAGGVVTRASNVPVAPAFTLFLGQEQMRMSSGDNSASTGNSN